MRLILVTLVAVCMASSASAQVILGQTDDFETGIANWTNPAGLATVQLGGPAGASDHFMRIATTGGSSGPGHQLIAFNQTQWIGDYTSQNIGAIEMDLKNINYPNGGAGMSVRIALRTSSGGSSTPAWVSDPFTLLADNNWHHAVYFLNETNFTPINSPPSFATVIGGGNMDFRILHNPLADAIGASTFPFAAQLGVDNIHAAPVPEPSSLFLCGIALVFGIRRFRRTKHRSSKSV
jgi:PEP-CTERM motif-containing protein